MSNPKIICFPDLKLRKLAVPVEVVNAEIESVVDALFAALYVSGSISLSAPQIGVSKSIMVIDLARDQRETYCLINPQILSTSGMTFMKEGCASLPEFYEEIPRPLTMHLRAFDRKGNIIEMQAEGLLARCIAHEMEHLDGKLIIDHLAPKQREHVKEMMKEKVRV